MRKIFYVILSTCLSLSVPVAYAADIKGSKDYPQIGRFKGSTIKYYKVVDFDEYAFLSNVVKKKKDKEKAKKLEGRVTRIAYHAPKNVSILEVQRNFETRLKNKGFDILLSCKDKGCGTTKFSRAIEQLPAPHMGVDSWNYRYLAAHKSTDKDDINVTVLTSTDGSKTIKTQVIIVESAVMKNKMTDASEMAKSIAATGSIALYGIYFDSGQSVIKAESAVTLKEIAKLMKSGKLKLIVVGHTDNQGGYQYNMKLSKERARSVVQELVNNYGINSSRLQHDGVGYLAPVSSNHTEGGRAKNRRVQLVEE